ncbi:MAG TPA: hypothetical protein VK474_11795 [Chthoniobacterales bacterium]|nr:hypothetical protein [Chthoniobacterales bacterium]
MNLIPPTRKLSDSFEISWWKRVFPALWFGLLFALFIGLSYAPPSSIYRWPRWLIPIGGMAIIGVAYVWTILFRLADEIADGDAYLYVRKGLVEDTIALADIKEVRQSWFPSAPTRIMIRLSKPSKLGLTISFLVPEYSATTLVIPNPLVAELTSRAEAARATSPLVQ